MLADEVVQFPQSPFFRTMPFPMQVANREFAAKVAAAQRFVLNRNAVMMVQWVADSSPRRFLTAVNVSVLPHAAAWVEFTYRDREDYHRDGVAKKQFKVVQRAGTSSPSRMGMLLEAIDGDPRHVAVSIAWIHNSERQIVNVSLLGYELDLRAEQPMLTEDEIARMKVSDSNERVEWQKWVKDPNEFEATWRLEARVSETIPSFQRHFWHDLARRGPEIVAEAQEMARFDLRREWSFALALLILFNLRNATTTSPGPDLSKINRARAKSGKPPLLDHRVIDFTPSRVQRNRVGTIQRTSEVERHVVRNHLKVRATGVFLWHEHQRGNVGDAPAVTTTIVRG